MSSTGGAPDLLAAEFVLGTLAGPERAEFERRIRQEPVLRSQVEDWQVKLQPLSDRVPPLPAPDRVWNNIAGRLGFERKRGLFGLPLAAWVAAAALVIVALIAVEPKLQLSTFTPEVEVALEDQLHQPLWKLEADSRTNRVRVSTLRRIAIAPDKSLELWLLRDGDQAPVSLGLMPVEGGSQRLMGAPLPLRSGSGFAVSLEPRGGSPTHLPTGPVLSVQQVRLSLM